jgi:hypothetical protein
MALDANRDLLRMQALEEMVEQSKGKPSYMMWFNKLEEFKRLLKYEVSV